MLHSDSLLAPVVVLECVPHRSVRVKFITLKVLRIVGKGCEFGNDLARLVFLSPPALVSDIDHELFQERPVHVDVWSEKLASFVSKFILGF